MSAILRQKPPKIFVCELCDFECSKTSDYERHILTRKHKNRTQLNILEQESAQKTPSHVCKGCNKEYKARNSLWYHEKSCSIVDDTPNENMIMLPYVEKSSTDNHLSILTNLVMEVVKSNLDLQKQSAEAQKQTEEAQKQSAEVQKQLLDICKNIQPSFNNNSNNTNTNTNTFNMQVFLNEECKDAINLSDFVNSFEVQMEDLESIGILGYTTGLSNMIIKELKLLDVYKRPFHCSDARREIFYVKDNNVWERETPDNSSVKKAIRGVTRKNMGKLYDWRDEHPDYMDSDSINNDIYIQLLLETCGGRGDTETNENKIFKNIIKEVLIKK